MYLAHHGIKGQKWGIRRYQNADGSLTKAGTRRYYKDAIKNSSSKEERKEAKKNYKEYKLAAITTKQLADLYGKNEKTYSSRYKSVNKAADKAKSKSDNYAKEHGKDKKYDKLSKKASRIKENADWAKSVYERNKNLKEYLNTKLNDMNSGKITAGKDFVSKQKVNFGSLDLNVTFNDGSEKRDFNLRRNIVVI